MLIPESKDEKKIAYLARFEKWVKTRPEKEQALFCEHGKYHGYNGALAAWCPECKENMSKEA
jgi:hypothetical protein